MDNDVDTVEELEAQPKFIVPIESKVVTLVVVDASSAEEAEASVEAGWAKTYDNNKKIAPVVEGRYVKKSARRVGDAKEAPAPLFFEDPEVVAALDEEYADLVEIES